MGQRRGVRIVMTGITGRLGTVGLSGQQCVTIRATVELFLVHFGVTTFAFGMHRFAQGRRVAVGLVTVTLVARAGLGLDVRVMMTIGTGGGILFGVLVMTVLQCAHFRVMALRARFLGQILLMVRRKLGPEFRGMA